MREKLIELMKSFECPWLHDNEACKESCRICEADYLIANGVTVTDNNVGGKWISVKERLPEPETEVVILAERKYYSFKEKGVTTHHIVTTGMYEDGSKNTEDSNWVWETDGFEYDEELDAYIIPEGWWEWKHYIDDECHNYAIHDVVTHWMPLPEPPKGE